MLLRYLEICTVILHEKRNFARSKFLYPWKKLKILKKWLGKTLFQWFSKIFAHENRISAHEKKTLYPRKIQKCPWNNMPRFFDCWCILSKNRPSFTNRQVWYILPSASSVFFSRKYFFSHEKMETVSVINDLRPWRVQEMPVKMI